MLARLRHHALIGGDHEQHQVDSAHPAQHVLDESLVAGHVDDPHRDARGRHERSEPEIDRDAALLLLGQSIGVDARQAAHHRRLAVVDVPRGAHDREPAHLGPPRSNVVRVRCASRGTNA